MEAKILGLTCSIKNVESRRLEKLNNEELICANPFLMRNVSRKMLKETPVGSLKIEQNVITFAKYLQQIIQSREVSSTRYGSYETEFIQPMAYELLTNLADTFGYNSTVTANERKAKLGNFTLTGSPDLQLLNSSGYCISHEVFMICCT